MVAGSKLIKIDWCLFYQLKTGLKRSYGDNIFGFALFPIRSVLSWSVYNYLQVSLKVANDNSFRDKETLRI